MNRVFRERLRAEQQKDELARAQREAARRCALRPGRLVRACKRPSWKDGPHDHDDPAQHFDSRIMGPGSSGRILVAVPYGDNPHRSTWYWSKDMLRPLADEDWAQVSQFHPGQVVFFESESSSGGCLELGFQLTDEEPGAQMRAVLEVPHIEPGDWLVSYEKRKGVRITRVLNERQMQP